MREITAAIPMSKKAADAPILVTVERESYWSMCACGEQFSGTGKGHAAADAAQAAADRHSLRCKAAKAYQARMQKLVDR